MRPTGPAPVVTTNDGKPWLNMSQISEWTRCRYRYDLTTIRRIQPRAISRPLDLGSAVHAGIAALLSAPALPLVGPYRDEHIRSALVKWYEREREVRSGFQGEEEQEALNIRSTAALIVGRQSGLLSPDRWQVVRLPYSKALYSGANENTPAGAPLVELGISKRFPSKQRMGWAGMHGTPDVVLEDLRDGGVWLTDFKVRGTFSPIEDEETNIQHPIYQYLLNHYGVEANGHLTWQIRNDIPHQPAINKDGSVSRARIATDWPTYRDAVIAAGQDPMEYVEMQQKLADVEFTRITRTYRSLDSARRIWDTVMTPIAKAMHRERKSPAHRSLNAWNCKGCRVKEFCLAELKGEDTEFLLSTSYVDFNNPREFIPLTVEQMQFDEEN